MFDHQICYSEDVISVVTRCQHHYRQSSENDVFQRKSVALGNHYRVFRLTLSFSSLFHHDLTQFRHVLFWFWARENSNKQISRIIFLSEKYNKDNAENIAMHFCCSQTEVGGRKKVADLLEEMFFFYRGCSKSSNPLEIWLTFSSLGAFISRGRRYFSRRKKSFFRRELVRVNTQPSFRSRRALRLMPQKMWETEQLYIYIYCLHTFI